MPDVSDFPDLSNFPDVSDFPDVSNLEGADRCIVCGSDRLTSLINITELPVHSNLLCDMPEQARTVRRGEMDLKYCSECGHVFNAAFEPELMDYSEGYEVSLHFSQTFQRYAESLAARLIDRYRLTDKNIIEIGCGRGEFLRLMCAGGVNRGIGFDTALGNDQKATALDGALVFVRDYYSQDYAYLEADLICCRHVLEHIPNPVEYLVDLRRIIGSRMGTVIYFEVPNVLSTLRDLAVWDLIYEHCSYFSSSSLEQAFRSAGFEVLSVEEAYGGQFLGIEARVADKSTAETACRRLPELGSMMSMVRQFSAHYHAKVSTWNRFLEARVDAASKAVVWGGGSKGVTFLNTLNASATVDCVVDINTRKQGKYIPGTGQLLVAPETLAQRQPALVLLMNAIYRAEVEQYLRDQELNTTLLTV